MKNHFTSRIGTVALLGAIFLSAGASAARRGDLAGRVSSARSPLPTVTVYAYELADLELIKTVTDSKGSFFFDQLPAGLYKVIAFKKGFVPAVLMLRRATTDSRQFVDLELVPESEAGETAPISFWEVREQIPADVLRDIQMAGHAPDELRPLEATSRTRHPQVETRMQATTGIRESLDFGAADVNGAAVGVSAQLADYLVDFDGRFAELEGQDSPFQPASNTASGSTQVMNLRLENDEGGSQFAVASRTNRLATSLDAPETVDFQHHRVSWTNKVGRTGRTDVTAQYTSENNYFREALIEPAGIPEGSRSLRLSGQYSGHVSERATIEAGVSYRERETDFLTAGTFGSLLPAESVELFGRGGLEVKPAMIVQYGLYSTLRDGTLSLSPQGGLVVEFGPNWRASTSFTTRFDQTNQIERPREFLTSFYGDGETCRQGERYCYEFGLARQLGINQHLSVGAVHRKVGETQRVYFSDDFFNRLDSLYLVDGDSLPELKFEFTRRLAPTILARVRSNLATGGGGVFRPVDTGKTRYENNVSYLVTSFDTQFEATSTGVFVAFHRLQQELEPLNRRADRLGSPELQLDRLQVMLSQDLDILHELASDWAVHLNMELSRGGTSTDGVGEDHELRKRVTGGVAVKF